MLNATRDHFGGVVGVVGFAGLSHSNYKPTMGGRCIGTPSPIPTGTLDGYLKRWLRG
jgi:hypothetical protein